MAVQLSEESLKYFDPKIVVRFAQLPEFPRALTQVGDKPDEVRYRLFNRVPTQVSSAFPPEVMVNNGKDVMLAHAPCSLEFEVPATLHRLSGKFGLINQAYEGPNGTDGAEFIIDWIDGAGKRTTLFRRLLRPRDIPADRGEQAFEIALPLGPGKIDMRTTAGSSDNISFDWTYWTDVRFSE